MDAAVPAATAEQNSTVASVVLSLPCDVGELKPKPTQKPWTNAEIEAMTLTLAGECYDDKPLDKRFVCEVILNRVSNEGFGDTILGVITAPNQFDGYWQQSRPVSDADHEIATQTLEAWYKNDCEALSEYLFFEAGDNRENEFRKEF